MDYLTRKEASEKWGISFHQTNCDYTDGQSQEQRKWGRFG